MRLRSLDVRSFGCVEQARVELGPGLNVLYGPNDLGKSTLAHAIRAGLLLPVGHRDAQRFVPWHRDARPQVDLELQARDDPTDTAAAPRTWRLRKRFGGSRGEAELSWSNDGRTFSLEQKGPGVDEVLRRMLGWGIIEARGKGARGVPTSFLATVLLGPQALPSSMLGHSLDDDPTESGRARLTEALQALAQDGRFKEVLDHAQAKMAEAFTPTGKPRSGKRSPLSPIQQRIGQLREELRQLEDRLHDSDDVRQRVQQLDGAHADAIAARDEAEATLRRMRAAYELGQQRARARARAEQAEVALLRARAVLAELQRWDEAAQRHLSSLPTAEAALDRALQSVQDARQQHAQAAARLQAIEDGGDATGRLARQQLETRRLELAAEHERVRSRLQAADRALALVQEIEEQAASRGALRRDREAAEREASEAEARGREAEAERRRHDNALRLRRWQDARDRVKAAEAARDEAERLEREAAAAEVAADGAATALEAEDLPTPETLEAWRTLAQERRVAQARLEVGLSVRVHRAAAGTLAVGRDDAAPAPVVEGEVIEAQQRLRLRLGDDTELEVQAGDAEARAARDALELRWQQEVAPTLTRLALDDLTALRERVLQAQARQRALQRQRDDAQTQRRLAEASRERAAALPTLRKALQASEQALGGLDRETLAADPTTAPLDEAELQHRRSHAEAQIGEAQRRAATARSKAAGLEGDLRAAEQAHARLVSEHQAVLDRLTEDPEVEREMAFDRLAAVEGEQETVATELAELEQAQARRRAEATAALQQVQQQLELAQSASEATQAEVDERKRQLAEAEGRLAQLRDDARALDPEALEDEHATLDAAWRALPEPALEVDAEALAQAETELEAKQRALREVEADRDQQRGALKQVGGAVVREEAERTREALEVAKRSERDLELDYQAWRLLAETLREAETAEGRHLGEALGKPVHDRFAALTGGRYGALSLGRDLQAQGLEVAGRLRDVDQFSEGVQDQLATILRLAIAEHLGTALVLDDHLAQTDPARVAWFREVLLQVAERAQIVVLTCRPEDYLRAEERPGEGEAMRDTDGLRAIDLTRVIRRA